MKTKLKPRLKKEFNSFRGFDFTQSPENVDFFHSPKGKNLIYENGVNKKRKGFKEVFCIKQIKNSNIVYPKINGIFQFSLNSQNFLIVYAGTRFYSVENVEGGYVYTDITFSSTNENVVLNEQKLKDVPLTMIKDKNKVYFVGMGDFVVFAHYGSGFELRRVENNDDTFVPITLLNGKGILFDDGSFDTPMSPNILCSKRINCFVGKDNTLNDDFEQYRLDYILPYGSPVEITYTHTENEEEVVTTITNSDENVSKLVDKSTNEIMGYIFYSNKQTTFSINNKNTYYEGKNNIKVVFETAKNELCDEICSAKVASTFGADGKLDRLFLGSTNNLPNADFYSESEDFTYFTSSNQSMIGTPESKIMSYMLLSDGTMAILKEKNNLSDTIFYRSSSFEKKLLQNGKIVYTNVTFPVKTGAIGEGVVSPYACATLQNEKLFLSSNGVFSLSRVKNISSTEHYAKEKSQLINGSLLKNNLSNAVATTFKNRYYLAVDNKVYILDTRFKSQTNLSNTEKDSYDWWYWEDVPVKVWSIVDDNLFFGTSNGQVCCFTNEFKDTLSYHTNLGDLLISFPSNLLVFNTNLNIKNNTLIKLTDDFYVKFIEQNDILSIENNVITIKPEKMRYVKNGTKLTVVDNFYNYFNCFLNNVDFYNHSFCLIDENNNEVNLPEQFYLALSLKDFTVKASVLEEGKMRFKFVANDEVLTFVNFNNSSILPLAEIMESKNVKAVWFTPVTNFGSIEKTKTLLKISVSVTPSTNSVVKFGYCTKFNQKDFLAEGTNYFSFFDFNFTNFTFNTSFSNSFTIDLKEDFNYIQFYFESDSPSDFVVNNVSVIYKENKFNQGVN